MRLLSLSVIAAMCACCADASAPRTFDDAGTPDGDTDTGPTFTSMPGWELTFAVRAGGDEIADDIPYAMWREAGELIEPLDDGSVYLVGQVGEGAVFGEGGAAETTLPSGDVGWSDGFLARYDPEGDLDWVRKIGGDDEDHVFGVDSFADGSAVVAGRYDSLEMTLGEGESNETVLSVSHPTNAFVARYSPSGELDWAISIPSSNDCISYARAAFALPDERTLVAGMFFGTLWPGEPLELTSEPTFGVDGDGDGFLAWLDADGAVLGSRRIGGDAEDYWGRQFAVSDAGALYAALPYYGDEVFGEAEANETTLHCESDPGECATALARYATDGALEWVENVNAARASIAAIGDEAIGLAGFVLNPESFLDEAAVWTSLWDTGYIAVAKYGAADGQLEWVRFAEMDPWYDPKTLAVAGVPDGGLIAALEFEESLSFAGSGAEPQSLISDGEATDLAIVSLAPDGEIRWVHRIGSEGDEHVGGVSQQGGSSIWITGAYGSDPFVVTSGNGDDVSLPLSGKSDVFLARFDSTSPPTE